MRSTTLIILLFFAAAMAVVFFSLQGDQSPEAYLKEIASDRKEKDNFMRNGEDSPFKGATEPFHGLNYFPPDANYRVTANLVPIEDKKMILLSASDGQEKKYLEYAYAEFELDGKMNKLLILEVTEVGPYRGTLYLAFADETSAKESYGAGRYLDIKKIPGASSMLLDFNKAYNPYCAYADNFSCPFPPGENVLRVAIRAGEKSYH